MMEYLKMCKITRLIGVGEHSFVLSIKEKVEVDAENL